jgi:predicted ATP-binding protein involved in virulence
MTTEVLELENAGPIQGTFAIDVSKGPGLYVLRGSKGSGKSTVLKSLELLRGCDTTITIHDGELSGHVSGFGVVRPLGARKRAKGDFELESLGDVSFADFVHPQGKTPETRDKQCIQALVALTGVKADPSVYYPIVFGKDAYDRLGVKATDDPILLASRVKEALDAIKRKLETTADVEQGNADQIERQAGEYPKDASDDVEAALAARDAAKKTADRLYEQASQAAEQEKARHQAQKQLDAAKANYAGPTSVQARTIHDAAVDAYAKLEAKVEELKRELHTAQHAAQLAAEKATSANATLQAAVSHEKTVSAWQIQLDAPVMSAPTDEQRAEAAAAVAAANAAHELAVKVREARQRLEQAAKHKAAAADARKKAEKVKAAAGEVFATLAGQLKTTKIMVESVEDQVRLVCEHPRRRKKVFFNGETDLSEGERTMLAIEELLPRIDSPGLFALPQESFAAIQPLDRKSLHAFAIERGIYVWGAIISDGPLNVQYGWDE